MTDAEFSVWFLEHSTAFPTLLSWLDNLSAKTPGMGDRTMGVWRSTLADVSLEHARLATQRMVRGDEELPKLMEETPLRVRKIANMARYAASMAHGSYRGGRWVPNCELCNDRGLTSIWQPQLCRMLAETFPEPEPLDSVAITRSPFWQELASRVPYLNQPVAIYCSCQVGAELREAQVYTNERTGRKVYKMRQMTALDVPYRSSEGSFDLNPARERGRKMVVGESKWEF